MSNNLGGSVIQLSLRGDTLARWSEFNPVLGERELVVETDTRRFKIGDGSGAYLSLPYAGVTADHPVSTALAGSVIDLSAGAHFRKTISAPTVLSVTNAAAPGFVSQFTLTLVNAGAHELTWFAGVRWPGGLAPVLSAGTDRLSFTSDDGGATWHAQVLALDSKAAA